MAEALAPQPRTFAWKENPNYANEQAAAMRQHLTLGDPAVSNACLANTMSALHAISSELRATKWGEQGGYCSACKRKGMGPEALAKTASYLAKMLDETFRLLQFAEGGPDSRTEVGLGDLLQVLKPEQFNQLQEWIAAGKAQVVNTNAIP